MGFRMRKSVQIVPGVRMNFSRSGIGYSVGGKGLRVTRHANGRVSRTVSIPGTGLSHQQTLRAGSRRGASSRGTGSRRAAVAPPPSNRPVAPGMFAPAWEKDLFAVLESRNPSDYMAVARKHGSTMPTARVLAAALEGLLHFQFGIEDPVARERARALLGWVVPRHDGLSTLPFVTKYLAERTWPVEIVHGVEAELRFTDNVVLLAAAELHQSAGDLAAAIWTVEQAHPTTHAALSLVELYSDAGRHREVIDMTNGIGNSDDASALLLALRGRAFAQLGYSDAARENFKEALRLRSRAPEVRHRALLERAQVDLAQNRKATARKSIEKVLAEDPGYPGLADLLVALH
ncbi:DUF4236 domain-containing protein [Rhodococcus sp. NPDC049939]|uniref:DUF4236 domain-containing protein n=1 Tax=Rhodococcus sp. NPDC049939 TaxID=3155511 RepID=UPI0033D1885F